MRVGLIAHTENLVEKKRDHEMKPCVYRGYAKECRSLNPLEVYLGYPIPRLSKEPRTIMLARLNPKPLNPEPSLCDRLRVVFLD